MYLDDDHIALIGSCKDTLISLLRQIVIIQYHNFGKTKIYAKIKNRETQARKKNAETFTYIEQNVLESEINHHFDFFIKCLKNSSSGLTGKELLICCLVFRFSPITISNCLGYANTVNYRKHKNRIKRKLNTNPHNAFLFEFIFGK
jgi:hypothetical protein